MKLRHKFNRRATVADRLTLSRSGTLSKFTRNLTKIAEQQDPLRYKSNDYKGDGFEWFAEYFFKVFHSDKLFIKVSGYEPITKSSIDFGIDGFGKYVLDLTKNSAVQVKFKSDQRRKLSSTEDQLSNLGVHASTKYGVEIKSEYIVVFTNCSGITSQTMEGIYNGEVRCIDKEIISRYVDNNDSFWKGLEEYVTSKTVTQKIPVTSDQPIIETSTN